ncbi:MAG: hypothetical protein WCG01_04310 [bacterium]
MNKLFVSKIIELKLAIILALTSTSALVYFNYQLNHLGIIWSLLLSSLIIFILAYFGLNFNLFRSIKEPLIVITRPISFINYFAFTVFYLLAISLTKLLLSSPATSAIISPWEIIPFQFFYLYFIFLALGFYLTVKFNSKITIWTIFLFTFSLIMFVYRLGYGYDFFIHGASLKLIDETGQILPKNLYYNGYYGLITLLHKTTLLPLFWLHQVLVPLLAIIYIPFYSMKYLVAKQLPNWPTLILLILPLSFLTFTTPQNFGYLLFCLLVLNLNTDNTKQTTLINILLVAAGLSIHPISGIPGLLLFGLNFASKKWQKSLLYLSAIFLVPLSYYFSSFANAKLTWPNLSMLVGDKLFTVPYKFNLFLNTIYLLYFNQIILILGLIVAAFYLHKTRLVFKKNYLLAVSLTLSGLIMSMISNSALINYEQADYAARLFTLSFLTLLPIFLELAYYIYHHQKHANLIIKIIFVMIFTTITTANLYFLYPRNDEYFNSRGVSVGQADIEAVTWINEHAKQDFIVLANQQVSAAALHLYGFKKYFKNDIFYYPIPTGGPLYGYYLEMVYESPNQSTMNQAKNLVGVNESYFVINKYWTDSARIIEEAKTTSKEYKSFDNGEVYVFKY